MKLKQEDNAAYVKTDQEVAQYLDACMQEAALDTTFLAKALGISARTKGVPQFSRDTGLGRDSLYKALWCEGNPGFATILKVTNALGIRLRAQVAQKSSLAMTTA